jgi:hypothetical protein
MSTINPKINWNKIHSYVVSDVEEKVIKVLFSEWIDPKNNSVFEDMSETEIMRFYEGFRTGWVLSNLYFE